MTPLIIQQLRWPLLLFVSLLFYPLVALLAEESAQNELVLTEVVFEEVEAGLEPFKSRLLLAKNYLRLDDGDDRGDFILFDRHTHEIHSFNHEDRSHLVMKSLPVTALEFIIKFNQQSQPLLDAPKVNGVTPVQHHFFADQQLCKKSINVTGLLPELTQVLIEYESVIVEQNKQTLSQIPSSVRSSCYMANNYLHASDYLRAGFPLFVVDDQGRQKMLQTIRQVKMNQSIMQKPGGYSVYYPNASNLNKQD